MALTRIEYGALASSDVMNNNFEYLEDSILALASTVRGNYATVNSNIAGLNTTITTVNNALTGSINQINTDLGNFSSSGLYVDTYVNGHSWYREYFSDEEKTVRVWLEQGGIATTNTVTTLLKTMSNSYYTIVLGRYASNSAAEGITIVDDDAFYLYNEKNYQYSCGYYVCGI